ncbi:MAG: tRNA-specific adenosine deaminase [Gemmatimonadota bacterium]|nr:MAG: tRNA-specific adenosine deaminase [Gemmatimonadota bacterium]
MERALELAQEAGNAGEVPVGAVVVSGNTLVAVGRNRMQEARDPRAHAEMEAISAAREQTGTGRLDGHTLYVTLEPCPMCAGALLLARLDRVVFGAWDPRLGACGSQFDLPGAGILGDVRVRPEVLQERCSRLLSQWFDSRRQE